jgi:hypothetical protein
MTEDKRKAVAERKRLERQRKRELGLKKRLCEKLNVAIKWQLSLKQNN